MSSHLQFFQLSKRFGQIQALNGVSFGISEGSVLALLGPNGAGKSTLFGCLLGLIRPSDGRVSYSGSPINDAHRRRFGYMPERVALYPHRTVRDNGLFFANLRGHSKTEFERQLERVGLASALNRKVRQLSKGMLQRLGLAIALCGQPETLILDEPFNGLDPALLEELQDILREESRRGATLLISTHTMSAVEPLATDVAILFNGKLAAHGSIESMRAEAPEASLESIYFSIGRRPRAIITEEVFV